jgi:hypothetical protein
LSRRSSFEAVIEFDDLIHVNPSRHLGVLRPSCETIRPLRWFR